MKLTVVACTGKGVRCYERRRHCLKHFGWCSAIGAEGYRDITAYGYCSEVNFLPDRVDNSHPLFEVGTFIYPKSVNTVFFPTIKVVYCPGYISGLLQQLPGRYLSDSYT